MAYVCSFNNPVFRDFALHSTVVAIKTLAMGPVTIYYRIRKKVYANEEDTAWEKERKVQPVYNDPDVERSRRCHLNDLENVVPFFMIGILYVFTGPSRCRALWHFRIFTASRFLFTFAYLIPLPIPTRGLGFYGGLVPTISMAVTVIRRALRSY